MAKALSKSLVVAAPPAAAAEDPIDDEVSLHDIARIFTWQVVVGIARLSRVIRTKSGSRSVLSDFFCRFREQPNFQFNKYWYTSTTARFLRTKISMFVFRDVMNTWVPIWTYVSTRRPWPGHYCNKTRINTKAMHVVLVLVEVEVVVVVHVPWPSCMWPPRGVLFATGLYIRQCYICAYSVTIANLYRTPTYVRFCAYFASPPLCDV